MFICMQGQFSCCNKNPSRMLHVQKAKNTKLDVLESPRGKASKIVCMRHTNCIFGHSITFDQTQQKCLGRIGWFFQTPGERRKCPLGCSLCQAFRSRRWKQHHTTTKTTRGSTLSCAVLPMQTKQIKLPVWKNSNASKELLKKDIEEEGLIEVMTAREARSAVTAAGLPPWHESNLERLLLNVFVNQLMHETMSPPPARHESRPEHQEVFSLHAFRQHMQQESHSRKETKCWLNTRTNKSSKNN